MLEYNSLQNLLGISPTNHKGSSAGGSPNKDHKNAINIFPVSKYKLQTEETKSKEQETRKEVDEEDGEEAPQLKRRDSFKTLKLPDIQIQNNDIPSRNSSPFAVSISYSKHSKSNSNIPKNLHNQTVNDNIYLCNVSSFLWSKVRVLVLAYQLIQKKRKMML